MCPVSSQFINKSRKKLNNKDEINNNVNINMYIINKRQRISKGQLKNDNPEKLATQGTQDEDKQNKNTTQYVFDTTI